jgi:hypothetical protein
VTAILFHGPGGEEEAISQAEGQGRLACPPICLSKISEARSLVDILDSSSLGSGRAMVVVGPMDELRQDVSDSLLKSLEEFDPNQYGVHLHARDIGEVSPTIVSRCIHRWCFAIGDSETWPNVASLVEASLSGDRATVLSVLNTDEIKDLGQDVLRASSDILASRGLATQGEMDLWSRVRDAWRFSKSSRLELMAVYL